MRGFLIFILLCLPGLASSQESPTDPNARDLLILTDWFEGEFDNEEQVWFQGDARSATPEDERHFRIHVIHKKVDLPAFGEHVFYVEEYRDNDPSEVIRQRLVIFTSDQKENAIRMRQGFFRDAEGMLGAHMEPDKLAGLTEEETFFLPGCDVFWHRVADQYEGRMKSKTCVFGEGDDRRYSVHDLVLSATKYWRVDSTFRVSDDTLFLGYPVDAPYRMRRAKIFECSVTFRDENNRPTRTEEGLRLHSQGGLLWLDPHTDGEVYGLRMRDKEYPYYTDRLPDFLLLSLMKKGQERMVGYALTDVDARRVGFNLGWALAHCAREGYTFRQPLAVLE